MRPFIMLTTKTQLYKIKILYNSGGENAKV